MKTIMKSSFNVQAAGRPDETTDTTNALATLYTHHIYCLLCCAVILNCWQLIGRLSLQNGLKKFFLSSCLTVFDQQRPIVF